MSLPYGAYSVELFNNIVDIYPNEYNGTGISTPLLITGIVNNRTNNLSYFNVPGDVSYRFQPGFIFTLSNSSSGLNNGTYTVAASSTYSPTSSATSIPVSGFVPNITPAGTISYSVTGDLQSTSLSLPGRGVLNYGDSIVTDLLQLMTNFASVTPPIQPNDGQLWFNGSNNTLNVYNNGIWSQLITNPQTYPDVTSVNVPPSGTSITTSPSGVVNYNYTISNSSSGNVNVIFDGIIYDFTFQRNTTFINLSPSTTNMILSPGDSITITYGSNTPSVNLVPI